MKTEQKVDRRAFLIATTTAIVAAPVLAAEQPNPDEGVTAPLFFTSGYFRGNRPVQIRAETGDSGPTQHQFAGRIPARLLFLAKVLKFRFRGCTNILS